MQKTRNIILEALAVAAIAVAALMGLAIPARLADSALSLKPSADAPAARSLAVATPPHSLDLLGADVDGCTLPPAASSRARGQSAGFAAASSADPAQARNGQPLWHGAQLSRERRFGQSCGPRSPPVRPL